MPDGAMSEFASRREEVWGSLDELLWIFGGIGGGCFYAMDV
jgi:hypothetical protein